MIIHLDDDDIDYEQLFDDEEISLEAAKPKKPVKRVRFAPILAESSATPVLSRPLSARPTFELEFDFDSLESPSIESAKELPSDKPTTVESTEWKSAFLTDLHIAKKNKPPAASSLHTTPATNKSSEDTLWDFMRESNPELLEKLERTQNDKQKRTDRFSTQQPVAMHRTSAKSSKTMVTSRDEGISQACDHNRYGEMSK